MNIILQINKFSQSIYCNISVVCLFLLLNLNVSCNKFTLYNNDKNKKEDINSIKPKKIPIGKVHAVSKSDNFVVLIIKNKNFALGNYLVSYNDDNTIACEVKLNQIKNEYFIIADIIFGIPNEGDKFFVKTYNSTDSLKDKNEFQILE